MNKRMRELLAQIQEKTLMAKALMEGENKDVAKANEIMDQVDALNKEYETEKRLYEAEKMAGTESANPVDPVEAPKAETETKDAPEVNAIAKFGADAKLGFKLNKASGDKFNETTPGDGGYTVPEDVVTKVNEYRDAKFSLLQLVTTTPVKTNKGSRTFKTRANQTGFTKVGEGKAIGAKKTPQFSRINYEIEKYAGYFPVTNEVLADSDANLGQILVEWIGDESRVTANNLILTEIKKNDEVNLKDLDGIKKALNVTLGQAFKSTSKIITNDNGLQYLDTLKDGNGRYLLAPMPGDNMSMSLQVGAIHVPVVVVPNSNLPNDVNKIPFIIGDLKEGIVYFDRQQMNIKISDVAVVGDLNAYEEDLTLYRAIEREDVERRDEKAFVRGYIEVTPGE